MHGVKGLLTDGGQQLFKLQLISSLLVEEVDRAKQGQQGRDFLHLQQLFCFPEGPSATKAFCHLQDPSLGTAVSFESHELGIMLRKNVQKVDFEVMVRDW